MKISHRMRAFLPIRTHEDFSALENYGSGQSVEEAQDRRRQEVLDVVEEYGISIARAWL
jgi:hypothetical protein